MSQKYLPLKDHDTPIKVLFTGYLSAVGIGYFFALLQILFTHGMADGKFGLSVDDIVYSYYGNRSGSVLETQLNGAMKQNASTEQRFKIIQWVRDGAELNTYKADGIEAIVEERCVMCHNAQAPAGMPDFNKFEKLKALTTQDTGATFNSLIRVSHVHLFGISFIFMFVGLIFSFSETTSTKYKCIAVGMPYIFLVTDILSWWLTKINPLFAWLIILAGMGMGISFMFMWAISLSEMWLYKKIYIEAGGVYGQKLRTLYRTIFPPETGKNLLPMLSVVAKKAYEQWQHNVLPLFKNLLNRLNKPTK
ncbi:hypothetical protein [Crenothrix polyspora]|uniref:Elongation factor-1 alpha n=1 Tax=Crenothrix polyspora TaxID=360316 RepID=A0A1R4HCC2_9GAMM|nr:hypothetical protein [Crenothrix polyspora]SJM93846.1 conserved membrane hypothetical protein [Crenothrix polyspora]